jgi:ubiquitin C-terminal hydrolase
MNKDLKFKQPGDSKDFIIFILQQLHKELKSKMETPKIIQKNTINVNVYDEQITLNEFMKTFTQDKSVIADYFFGIYEIQYTCQNCQNLGKKNFKRYYFQNYSSFIFPLQGIRNSKCMAMKNNMINTVSIYDYFIYYQRITWKNQFYCDNCNKTSDMLVETKVFSTPRILLFIIDWGKDNFFNVKINFDEVIDLTQYCIGRDKPQLIYYLCGVVTYLDKIGQGSQYIASCKNCIDNKWYRFNDEFIYPIKDLKNEVFENGSPYILFYRKFD